MNTFAETEALLKLAMTLSKNTVKQIAEATGIKPNTLYKWKTTDAHLSPQKADTLLRYFINNELQTIITALVVNDVQLYLQNNLASLTEEDVREGGMKHDDLF